MLKKILACGMLIVIILTATACKSSKDTYSGYSVYDDAYESILNISNETSENSQDSDSTQTSSKTSTNSALQSSEKTNSTSSQNNSSNADSHKHNYTDGSCTEPSKCTVCGDIKTEAQGHYYVNGNCIWCYKTEEGFIKYYPVAVPEFTLAELNDIFSQEYVKPKNVIFMIGDGMGPNDIIITEKFGKNLADYGLAFNRIPNNGFAITTNVLGETTDSAASATALATGTKTKNGYVGLDKDGNKLKNISETAKECGKKVGIVTNDGLAGATPSAFISHSISRGNEFELVSGALSLKPDVYVGGRPGCLTNAREDLIEDFLVTTELTTINKILNTDLESKKPYLGFFSGVQNNLDLYTKIALTKLQNENGFFLMVENTTTDSAGHSNNVQGKIDAVKIFDKTFKVVLDFVKDNPDTLLIITSDHETGGLQLPEGDAQPTDDLFTTTWHSSTPVKVFALGYGSEYFNGKTVDNTDIAKFAISAVKGE